MALVEGRTYVSVDFVDTGGNTTTRRFYLASGVSDVTAAVTALINALVALTNAVIKAYRVVTETVESDLSLPASNVQVEENALMTCELSANPLKSATFNIPAPKPGSAGIFEADEGATANVVDMEDVAVTTFLALFEDSGDWTISDDEQLNPTGSRQGRRVHRKSSKSRGFRIG